MRYKVEISRRALRKFASLPRDVQKRLQPLVRSLAAEPRPAGAVSIKELDRCYRIRQGDYRIIYTVRDDRLVVLVLAVADRKEAYTTKEMAALRKALRDWER